MQSKKYLDELMRFHEAKEEAQKKAGKALGKFIKENNKNSLGEKTNIEYFLM